MNNAKIIILTGLLLSLLMPLYGQSIVKKSIVISVFDKKRKPISYCAIRITSKSGVNILQKTDSLGVLHFDLLCDDTYEIAAVPDKFLGKRIRIESPCQLKKTKIKFILKPSVIGHRW